MREKLIELLKETDRAAYEALKDREDYQLSMLWEYFADHLIANGVTFATDNNVGYKWIPVTERLPEKDVLVLCIGSRGGMFIGYPRWVYEDEKVAYTVVPNSRHGRQAKYWTPLPEPPKEGE
jgi:hypothetical protein